MSLPLKRWEDAEADESLVSALAAELKESHVISRLLIERGITTADDALKFLNPRLSDLSDPYELSGMKQGVARIWQAIDENQRIAVFGDYDVDGVTSSATVLTVLQSLGADVKPFLPHRLLDGYGMSRQPLERCIGELNPDLVITVDCGTNSCDAVQYASERGVEVIITDHHEPHGDLANASAIINPKLGSDPATLPLAGVGVAFKLCHGLVKHGLQEQRSEVADIDLREWLDYVAIGTVADIVPLTGDNRILVRHGLARLSDRASEKKGHPRAGLEALMDLTKIDGKVSSYHIGFVMGPRINAAGRMGSADAALELMVCDDPEMARDLASTLEDANNTRKKTEDSIRSEAETQVDELYGDDDVFGIVAASKGWHIGINGIVASRLSRRYGRPAVVIAVDEEGNGTGSCRSIDCLDILEVLNECEEHLEGYGGHKMAAGLQIKESRVEAFRERFNSVCSDMLKGKDLRSLQRVDSWVSLGDVDQRLFSLLEKLEPHGVDNPQPVLGARSVNMAGPPRIVGKKEEHVKMMFASGGAQLDAIAFGFGKYDLPEEKMDILFKLQDNTFAGRTTLQLNILDISG